MTDLIDVDDRIAGGTVCQGRLAAGTQPTGTQAPDQRHGGELIAPTAHDFVLVDLVRKALRGGDGNLTARCARKGIRIVRGSAPGRRDREEESGQNRPSSAKDGNAHDPKGCIETKPTVTYLVTVSIARCGTQGRRLGCPPYATVSTCHGGVGMGFRTIKTSRWVPVLLGMLFTGCKTWEPATVAPATLIADAQPSVVRVTDGDGIQTTLRNPIVVNDSLISAAAPQPGVLVSPPRVGVAADDVALLEVGHFSAVRSIALAGVIAVGAITWAGIQASVGGGEERPEPLPKDTFTLIALFRLLKGAF